MVRPQTVQDLIDGVVIGVLLALIVLGMMWLLQWVLV